MKLIWSLCKKSCLWKLKKNCINDWKKLGWRPDTVSVRGLCKHRYLIQWNWLLKHEEHPLEKANLWKPDFILQLLGFSFFIINEQYFY